MPAEYGARRAAPLVRMAAAVAPAVRTAAALALAVVAAGALAPPAVAAATPLAPPAVAAAALDAPPATAQEQEQEPREWVVPRTPAGHPDLQGNWSNATITTIQRRDDLGPVYTWEEVAEIEGWLYDSRVEDYADSDPNREAPPVGGVFTGNPLFDAASGGTGGYNAFFIDAGERVAVFNGEPRTSLVVDPDNGRLPQLSEEGRRRMGERRRLRAGFGAFDNPENRPLAERCIMSFGSNAGPPMLPNYFYNNNYTIVQTPDHVMIMTEMVHDVRVIRLGEPNRLPKHIRPWMGDSWGRWAGDTLVVETTNLHPNQTLQGFPPSEEFRVTERFTRADETTINYEFTVEDPLMFTRPWSGEVPFTRLDGLVYEYACHEANYALENVLRGARAEERRDQGN
ncbi:MAG: hypothetical protein OXH51_12205 [Gemmatimonadetes bacterium]|nr:hypothetical protein [Gemmatimonadota bacterium]